MSNRLYRIQIIKPVFEKLYKKYKTFDNESKNSFANYSEEDIEKIKTILDVINIRLSINSKPFIIYIPFQDFPSNIQRFEIIGLLYKIDKDLKALSFSQITDGQKLAEQQVCIRVEDDKVKFNQLKKSIDEKYQEITQKKNVKKQTAEATQPQKEKSQTKTLVLGPLEYKNNSIYYNDSILKLTPQMIKLCKLFMERPDEYISDDSITEYISTNDFLSTENMQKIVSKLRTTLRKENNKIDIKRISNSGYNFMVKKIL